VVLTGAIFLDHQDQVIKKKKKIRKWGKQENRKKENRKN
jgi:hypothetical protein